MDSIISDIEVFIMENIIDKHNDDKTRVSTEVEAKHNPKDVENAAIPVKLCAHDSNRIIIDDDETDCTKIGTDDSLSPRQLRNTC